MRRIAVLAHYDVDRVLDIHLRPLICQLAECCERVIIVSTSAIDSPSFPLPSNVHVLRRENRGYDFCSYRHGIESIADLWAYDQLILVNDSFYCTTHFSLETLLASSAAKADIAGLTESWQFAYHLGSYFLLFNRTALRSQWFLQFWSDVSSKRYKLDMILSYEVGLSQSARRAGLVLRSIGRFGRCRALCSRLCGRLRRDALPQLNPTIAYAIGVRDKLGIIKIDLIRSNLWPGTLEELCGGKADTTAIRHHCERTQRHYGNRILSPTNRVMIHDEDFDYVQYGSRKASAAVVLHLHYPDLAAEIAGYLDRIPVDYDLFVSVTDMAAVGLVRHVFAGKARSLFVYVVDNRGRDIRPFIMLVARRLLESYGCVLKLHSKRSRYSTRGDEWRRQLYEGLLPSGADIRRVLELFATDRSVGIVAPSSSYLSNSEFWGSNKERVVALAGRLNASLPSDQLLFVGGSMFWFAPRAFTALAGAVDCDRFEPEQGQQDGTLAHVLERTFCLAAYGQGLRCLRQEAPSDDADRYGARLNRPIVLPPAPEMSGIAA